MTIALLVKVVIDFCLLLLVIIVSILSISGLTCSSLAIRGFFCDDESLRYPYQRSLTVEKWGLWIYALVFPLTAIIVLEIIIFYYLKDVNPNLLLPRDILGIKIPPVFWNIFARIAAFIFGFAVTLYVTNFTKFAFGRLRPYFFDVCKPNLNTLTSCNYSYILKYQCLGDEMLVFESRLSFPSDYASLSMYTAVFVIIYIYYRIIWNISFLFKLFLQCIVFIFAVYIGITQVSDYHHHWSDTLGGFILGILIATVTCVYVLLPQKQFRMLSYKIDDLRPKLHHHRPRPRSSHNPHSHRVRNSPHRSKTIKTTN